MIPRGLFYVQTSFFFITGMLPVCSIRKATFLVKELPPLIEQEIVYKNLF
jgi:hypothetical protein